MRLTLSILLLCLGGMIDHPLAAQTPGNAFADSLIAKTDSTVAQDSSQATSDIMVPFRAELVRAAHRHGVPAALLAAFCQEESGFNPWAERSEPKYWSNRRIKREAIRWSKSHKGLPTATTELSDRAKSMGLMQPMGEVAREQGYDSAYLSSLFTPFNSIDQGALLLKKLLQRYGTDTLAAISSYNQGSPRQLHGTFANARYVYRVSVAWRHYDKALHYADLYDQRKENLRMALRSRDSVGNHSSAAQSGMQRAQDTAKNITQNDSISHSIIPIVAGYGMGTRYGSGEGIPQSEGESIWAHDWSAINEDRFFWIGFLVIAAGLLGLVIDVWRYGRPGSGHDQRLPRRKDRHFLSRSETRAA